MRERNGRRAHEMEMREDKKIQRKRNEDCRGERRRGQKSGDLERLSEKENVRERPREIGRVGRWRSRKETMPGR